jgi:hypothetical protein
MIIHLRFHHLFRKDVSFLTLQAIEDGKTERKCEETVAKKWELQKASRLKWEAECRQNFLSKGERKKNE